MIYFWISSTRMMARVWYIFGYHQRGWFLSKCKTPQWNRKLCIKLVASVKFFAIFNFWINVYIKGSEKSKESWGDHPGLPYCCDSNQSLPKPQQSGSLGIRTYWYGSRHNNQAALGVPPNFSHILLQVGKPKHRAFIRTGLP